MYLAKNWSFKIYPHDEDFREYVSASQLNIDFINLIDEIVRGETPDGVKPDFKGFTKSYNRSNWFQPRHEGALSRQVINVKLLAEDVEAIAKANVKDLAEKVRQGFHFILEEYFRKPAREKKASTAAQISTKALPLTIKDTEAYKLILERGTVGSIKKTQFTKFSAQRVDNVVAKFEKDFITGKTSTLKNLNFISWDKEKLTENLGQRIKNFKSHFCPDFESRDPADWTHDNEQSVYEDFVELRIKWLLASEMGVDCFKVFNQNYDNCNEYYYSLRPYLSFFSAPL